MALNDKPNKPQTDKNHSFFQSFKHAARGIGFAIKHETNLRRDILIAVLVLLAAYFLHLPQTDFLWLILVSFLVFQAELWNSVAEYIVDLTTQHAYYPLAKVIKDLSAGIVLLTALFAVIVGAIVFIPALLKLLNLS